MAWYAHNCMRVPPLAAAAAAAAAAGYALYGFLTMAMDSTAALLIALLDLHIVPPFDKPWCSLSLAEFWGRCGTRWLCCFLALLFFCLALPLLWCDAHLSGERCSLSLAEFRGRCGRRGSVWVL
jgi:hypothetical protein